MIYQQVIFVKHNNYMNYVLSVSMYGVFGLKYYSNEHETCTQCFQLVIDSITNRITLINQLITEISSLCDR